MFVISLFDGLALAFHRILESKGSVPKVVLATSINPKTVGGEKTMTFLFLRHLGITYPL